MPDDVDSFNVHCSALIATDTCQISWKFVNSFWEVLLHRQSVAHIQEFLKL